MNFIQDLIFSDFLYNHHLKQAKPLIVIPKNIVIFDDEDKPYNTIIIPTTE